jgi:uncharacterized protein UPF0158
MEQTTGVSAATRVSLDELLDALEYVSSIGTVDAAAYISRDTGTVYFVGIDMEPEEGMSEDFETSDRYVAVPSKRELDLGKRVVLRFAEVHVPEQYERIRSIFSRPGAYTRFKELLEAGGQLEAWYEFEHDAQREALSDWCAAQGFEPVFNPPSSLRRSWSHTPR